MEDIERVTTNWSDPTLEKVAYHLTMVIIVFMVIIHKLQHYPHAYDLSTL